MKSHISEADLQAYVDGQLGGDARAQVEDYLSANAEEAARVAAFEAQNAALADALNPVLNEPIPERLMRDDRRSEAPKPPPFRWLAVASIAFAVGLVGGAAGSRLFDDRSTWDWQSENVDTGEANAHDVGANVARAAVQAHRVFIPEVLHPVEVQGNDYGHLLHWLSKRLGYPMGLPDLKDQGFSLIGGRLLSGPQGPAALFMFETATGMRLTLYCGRMKPVPDTAFRYMQNDGTGTIYWTADNIGFAVTAPLERGALQKLAELFFAAMEQEPKRPT
jgi:anti-sigma factor RsiW